MITKIYMQNVGCYGEEAAVLETDKKINLIYGWNGSGKTIFSNFLKNKNKDGNVDNFSDCAIDGLKDEKILVYNQKFVEENFLQVKKQKGIFTISAKNKQAELKMEEAKNKKKSLEDEKDRVETRLEEEQREKKKMFEKLRDRIWEEIKIKYENTVFKFCLTKKTKSKKFLFDYVKNITKPKEKITKRIKILEKEYLKTHGENSTEYKEEIQEINFDFSKIEQNKIFSEVIVGDEKSPLTNLIKQLKNSDWVKQGFDYIKKTKKNKSSKKLKNQQCPFCQEETISNALYEQIESYFNENYKNKITNLKKLKDDYENGGKSIISKNEIEFLKNDFDENWKKDFNLLREKFTQKLNSNYLEINKKIKTPNEIIELKSTNSEKKSLNEFIEKMKKEIKNHNLKMKDKKKNKEEIKNYFWLIMRFDNDQTIDHYDLQEKQLKEKEKKFKNEIQKWNEKIKEQTEIIKSSQNKTVNIDKAIDNINNNLSSLGIENLKIEKEKEFFYKIKRANKNDTDFKTLSEGEKTIITFLYFLELCKGTDDKKEKNKEKIIVIDDPISSLTHIYVFNIAQFICDRFFKNKDYEQIFVLTHNLYFFNELKKIYGNKQQKEQRKLFRFKKSDCSKILDLKEDEINNEYESYWHVLKNHEKNHSNDVLIGNIMRNILEYFFAFTKNEKYKGAIKKLEGKLGKKDEIQSFLRFLDRESHLDANNIVLDNKEINIKKFKETFKKIFDCTGCNEHYENRMNNKN